MTTGTKEEMDFSYLETAFPDFLANAILSGAYFGGENLSTQAPVLVFLLAANFILKLSNGNMTLVRLEAGMAPESAIDVLRAAVSSHERTLGQSIKFTLHGSGANSVCSTAGVAWWPSLHALLSTPACVVAYKKFAPALASSLQEVSLPKHFPSPAELNSKQDPSAWLFGVVSQQQTGSATESYVSQSLLVAPHRQEAVVMKEAKRLVEELSA